VIKKLLFEFQEPSVEDLNTFMAVHTRGKTNSVVVRSALLKYMKWVGIEKPEEKIMKHKNRGRVNLTSDIDVNKLKLILEHFPQGSFRDALLFQFFTGCRQIEALFIERDKIRVSEDCVEVLVIQKGDRTRLLRVPKEPFEMIFSQEKYGSKKYVFLQDKHQELNHDDLINRHYFAIKESYFRAWQKACKSAELDGYSSHDARRAIIRAVNEKYGLLTACRVAGHADQATTSRYLPDDTVDTMKAVRDVI
jgi:integrase